MRLGRGVKDGLILLFLWIMAILLIAAVFVATWFSIYVLAEPLYWALQKQVSAGAFYFLGLLMMVLWPLALFGLAFLLLRFFAFIAKRVRRSF
ncbi:hypothetical protein HL653_07135 [Sphingomonas sp. AP4-R1]|uniref:hypothetical protein n=1 Tax=Sphingomonas sp. AP4-R1 TaxID=2735134 RepID=UPI0014937195|nr:hypothetical protein [Sphingomonas sp. AP4-R1]QJU57591.1 hypothetical protein HL653_07135 [Sphingomonas sp. AP4-R1]